FVVFLHVIVFVVFLFIIIIFLFFFVVIIFLIVVVFVVHLLLVFFIIFISNFLDCACVTRSTSNFPSQQSGFTIYESLQQLAFCFHKRSALKTPRSFNFRSYALKI